MKISAFSYSRLDTFVHRLSGITKLVCFLCLTTAVMSTYDPRIFLVVMALSLALMKIAQVRYRQIRVMLIYVAIFLSLNFVLTYLFAPEYGVEIYGTRHVLFQFSRHYTVTREELFYLCCKTLKYMSVIPLGILLFLTTDPSEFASSLNRVGISYKICTSLSLTLRYFPDVARDYTMISKAQQARGIELSRKAKAMDRLKGSAAILTPLILSTIDRIDSIANAMDLRGYGKYRKRTWYSQKPLAARDYASMALSAGMLAFTIYVRVAVNHSMFYNPFI